MEKKDYLLFVGILVAALLVRLWLAPMRGHVHDIEQFKQWTETAVTGNPLAIYNDSTANYPPLGLLPLVLVGHLYRAFFSAAFDTSSTTLTALLKLPGITADLVTAVVLFVYLRKRVSVKWGLVGLAAYGLNPAVIYNSAWWGQLESLATLPMLLAVMAAGDGRNRRAWFWLAVAVLVKPQAVVIGPVILAGTAWIFSRKGAKGAKGLWELGKGLGIGIVTGVVVLLPFIVVGQLPRFIAQIQASAGRQLFLTMNAHNFWFLVTLGRGSFAARETADPILDTQPLIGPLTGWHLGLLLFLFWTVFILYKTNFKLHYSKFKIHHSLFFSSAALVSGFYLLPAEAHERYLFPALVFLVPLLPGGRRYQLIYIMFSLTLFLNLFWVDSAVSLPGFTQNLGWGVVISAVNVGLLGYLVWDVLKSGDSGRGK